MKKKKSRFSSVVTRRGGLTASFSKKVGGGGSSGCFWRPLSLSLWRRREESTPVCPQSDAQIDWYEEMPLRGMFLGNSIFFRVMCGFGRCSVSRLLSFPPPRVGGSDGRKMEECGGLGQRGMNHFWHGNRADGGGGRARS